MNALGRVAGIPRWTADYSRPLGVVDHVAPLAVALAGFALNYWLTLRLNGQGVFLQFDVLFETDPSRILRHFAHGSERFWDPKHPNLITLINVPVRAAAELLAPFQGDAVVVRERLALLVVPVSGGVKTLLLYVLFRRMGMPSMLALLLCLLDIVSFSRVVHGSIPESFALSACAMAALYLLAVRHPTIESKRNAALWLAGLFVATGITITNIIFGGIVLGACALQAPRPLRHLVTAAMLCVLALSSTMIIAKVSSYFYRGASASLGYDPAEDPFVRFQPGHAIREMSVAVPFAMLASKPHVQEIPAWKPGYGPRNLQFAFDGRPASRVQVLIATLGWVMLLTGALTILRDRRIWHLGAASFGILTANILLHCWFGFEFFLYSQHWQVSSLLLIGAVGLAFARAGYLTLAVYTATIAVASAHNIAFIFDTLATTPP